MAKINKQLLFVLLIALLTRLLFFFDYHPIWWDSAVYIGMGKYLFSLAQQGLWEPIRPIIWPAILGFIWKLKLDPLFFGRLLTLILSLAIIYLTYLITKEFYDKKTAFISSILIAFSSILFFFTFRLYTEIPALFFILLALLFLLKQRYTFSGLFIGLAFLTKFPAGLFLICFLPLVIDKKKINNLLYYGYGFLAVLIPYLIFNQIMYGNFLFPFISASTIISKVAGCNYLNYHPWYYYLITILKDNFLNIFALAGIYFSIKRFNKQKLLLLLCFLLPLIYFTQLHCRDYRYLIIFLPFLSILSANGISALITSLNKKTKALTIILILIISITTAITYYSHTEPKAKIIPKEIFYRFAQNKTIQGEIWITNPLINLYVTKKVNLLYYPLYTTQKITTFDKYLNKNNISYIFLDTCGGGMTCSPEDVVCKQKTNHFINKLEEKFEKVYSKTFGNCHYYIFKKK